LEWAFRLDPVLVGGALEGQSRGGSDRLVEVYQPTHSSDYGQPIHLCPTQIAKGEPKTRPCLTYQSHQHSTMYKPYDTNNALAQASISERIRDLNDAFRTQPLIIGPALAGNQIVVTSGVAALGSDFIDRAVSAVRRYRNFGPDNDPYGEHDFGIFELDGQTLNWKIDYYDRLLEWGSPDPADPAVTLRVLTILLVEEY
jgi:hypothetical protein